jgi:hypothetical protein
MSLIPEIPLEGFRCLSDEEVRAMPSLVLLDRGGSYLATLILPETDYIKLKVEYLGEMSNGVMPKS